MHPAHSVDNRVRVYEDATGKLWVTHEELLLCGYRNIEDFDVIYANGKFYELQAYIRTAKSWWIEEVPVAEEETEANEPEAHEAPEGASPPVRDDPSKTTRRVRPLRKGTFLDPEA